MASRWSLFVFAVFFFDCLFSTSRQEVYIYFFYLCTELIMNNDETTLSLQHPFVETQME